MRIVRFLLPRISYIFFGAIFLGVVTSGPGILNVDGDLPRHLLVGNLILHTGQVPTTDLFSYRTIGHPSIPHEWLAEVIFAISFNWLGLNGVVLLTALLITLAFAIVYYDAFRRSGSLFTAVFFTFLSTITAAIHFLPRPHLFTFVLLAAWIAILERIRAGQFRWWEFLPIVMLLWVNLHGMFVLGVAVWLIYLAGSLLENPIRGWIKNGQIRSIFFGGIISLPVTLLSPSGIGIWKTVFELAGDSYITSVIPEYQSANFHEPGTWPFILMLALLLLAFSRVSQKIAWTHSLLAIVFTGFALYSSRMIPIFAILAAPIETELFASWMRDETWAEKWMAFEERISAIDKTANGAIWLAALIAAAALLFASGQKIDPQHKGNTFDPRVFPVHAVAWLKSHPQNGHMFNDFNWGGYILLELWPGQQIFIDGHTHIYGDALTREYENALTVSEGWENILSKYQITWAILPLNSSLARALQGRGWQVLYQDSTAIILRIGNGAP